MTQDAFFLKTFYIQYFFLMLQLAKTHTVHQQTDVVLCKDALLAY